jgi:hypothetical protein
VNWPLDNNNLVLGGWFALVGLVFGAAAAFRIYRGADSTGWPEADAVVAAARIDEDSDGQCSVEVDFRYTAGGEPHTRTETVPVWLPTRENAERVLAAHRPGTALTVRYHPDRPGVAVLRPGVTAGSWVWFLLGVGILSVGVAMMIG